MYVHILRKYPGSNINHRATNIAIGRFYPPLLVWSVTAVFMVSGLDEDAALDPLGFETKQLR